jgi:hypothetical protein
MRLKSLLALQALSFAIGSSVTAQEEENAPVQTDVEEIDVEVLLADTTRACFNTREIRSFDAISDEYVFVEGRGDEQYLLSMWGPCFGLRNSVGIAISNDFSRVCSNQSARIVYRDSGRMQSCRIRTVEAVASQEVAERIVELRRQGD